MLQARAKRNTLKLADAGLLNSPKCSPQMARAQSVFSPRVLLMRYIEKLTTGGLELLSRFSSTVLSTWLFITFLARMEFTLQCHESLSAAL